MVNDIRKTLSGAILDPEDKIKDVLDDNDFVSIVLETDRPNPSLEQAEVGKRIRKNIHRHSSTKTVTKIQNITELLG